MTDREKEILEAIFTVGYDRLDTDRFPRQEVDALIYKSLKLMMGETRILKQVVGETEKMMISVERTKVESNDVTFTVTMPMKTLDVMREAREYCMVDAEAAGNPEIDRMTDNATLLTALLYDAKAYQKAYGNIR